MRNLMGKAELIDSFYKQNFSFALGQIISEGLWEWYKRTYYNVYPAIAPMLLRLSLEFDMSYLKMPIPAFCIRFPEEKPPLRFTYQEENWHIRSILVGRTVGLHYQGSVVDGFILWVDTGEREHQLNGIDCPIHTYINLPVQPGMSLEKALHDLPRDPSAFYGMQMPDEIRTACAKIACTICLLENDPSIIEPDVLSKAKSCRFLVPDLSRPGRWLCGIYDKIVGQPTSNISPAFGAGCCSSMNSDRRKILEQL